MKYKQVPFYIKKTCSKHRGLKKFISNKFFKEPSAYEFQGIYYHLDLGVIQKKSLMTIILGEHEKKEVNLALKHFDASDTIVEFGACLGVASSQVYHAIRPKQYVAYEANSAVYNYAKALFINNGLDIKLYNAALGSGESMKFYRHRNYLLSSFERPLDNMAFAEESVQSVSLEKVISEHRPTAIFSDIEGAELEYLMPEKLEGIKKIVIELHPKIYGEANKQVYIENILGQGFKLVSKLDDVYAFCR